MCVSTHMYIHVCINTYVYIYIHIHIHMIMCVYVYMYTFVYIYIYIYTCVCIHTYIYIYIYIYIHTHTHISIHTCVRVHMLWLPARPRQGAQEQRAPRRASRWRATTRGAAGFQKLVLRVWLFSDDQISREIRIPEKAAYWPQWDLGCRLLVCSA